MSFFSVQLTSNNPVEELLESLNKQLTTRAVGFYTQFRFFESKILRNTVESSIVEGGCQNASLSRFVTPYGIRFPFSPFPLPRNIFSILFHHPIIQDITHCVKTRMPCNIGYLRHLYTLDVFIQTRVSFTSCNGAKTF